MADSKLRSLVIFGAGGFAREAAWLVSCINKVRLTWDFKGFIDKGNSGVTPEGYLISDTEDEFCAEKSGAAAAIAIADAGIRRKLFEKLLANNIEIASLIHPSVQMSEFVEVGAGSIICANSVVTTNVKLGRCCIINPNCFVGHDTVLGDFTSLMPSSNIAGDVCAGANNYFGINSCVKNQLQICSNNIFGAGAVVVKDIVEPGVYAGCPVKKLHDR